LKRNKLKEIYDKWLTPIIAAILIGAASWVFFSRLEKLENLTSKLNDTTIRLDTIVGEMDKTYSKDAESKGLMLLDINNLKIDVKVLQSKIKP
jgi:hypothetical protein